jgi:hypothetical protein
VANPKDVLRPNEYSNYRNVRAVSGLFVLVGSVLMLGGIVAATEEPSGQKEPMHPAVAVGIAVVGLTGAVGGVAALRGSRRWAPMMYVMAAIYVFGFPVGTVLSLVLFSGLRQYLLSVEKIRNATAEANASAV